MNQDELKGMIKKLDSIVFGLEGSNYNYESAKIAIDAIKTRFELMKQLDKQEEIASREPLLDPKGYWDYMHKEREKTTPCLNCKKDININELKDYKCCKDYICEQCWRDAEKQLTEKYKP